MKNITFTYMARKESEAGEACLTVPFVEDERANIIHQAVDHWINGEDVTARDFSLYRTVLQTISAVEELRGRYYIHDSIKTVEIEEVYI